MTRRFRKEDVTQYYDHGQSYPAVNVKVYGNMTSRIAAEVARDNGADDAEVARFVAYFEELADSDNAPDWLFQAACESEAEYITAWILHEEDALFPEARDVYFLGRSGGWLCVGGLPDVETWDAIMVTRWAKLARVAREIADGIPYQMLSLLYLNNFEELTVGLHEDAELARSEGVAS